jgi:molecular chaperone GrpE
MEPLDEHFDPQRHEAVMHEPSDEPGEPVVVEVLRVGYGWRGRTLRPAMVRVRG